MGGLGTLINICALVYGVAAIILLVAPVDSSLPFLDRGVVLVGLSIVLGTGLLYMIIAQLYGRSNALRDDALEVAAAMRAKSKCLLIK